MCQGGSEKELMSSYSVANFRFGATNPANDGCRWAPFWGGNDFVHPRISRGVKISCLEVFSLPYHVAQIGAVTVPIEGLLRLRYA